MGVGELDERLLSALLPPLGAVLHVLLSSLSPLSLSRLPVHMTTSVVLTTFSPPTLPAL